MGRKWTAEQKEAARQRALERMAKEKQLDIVEETAKKAEEALEAQKNEAVVQGVINEPRTTIADDSEASTNEILSRAVEAINLLAQLQANGQVPQNTGPAVKNGQLTGTLDRFSVNPRDYLDFTARLAEEPGLRRFGFKENFELTYKYEVVRYQTIDKIWMQEPKITIDLNRKIYNDETGELTSGRYKEFRIVIHEDPDTAIYVARANGIDVPEDPESETGFLNEMRYLQVRDWLLECFMPKRPTSHSNRREMVVNGKLVEYFETNSEDSAKLPFDQLGSKL